MRRQHRLIRTKTHRIARQRMFIPSHRSRSTLHRLVHATTKQTQRRLLRASRPALGRRLPPTQRLQTPLVIPHRKQTLPSQRTHRCRHLPIPHAPQHAQRAPMLSIARQQRRQQLAILSRVPRQRAQRIGEKYPRRRPGHRQRCVLARSGAERARRGVHSSSASAARAVARIQNKNLQTPHVRSMF